jgi:RimJ/RimL family protein N-acetyltransferase
VSTTFRPVRADEWRQVRGLRLAATSDPLAHLAFYATRDEEAARPDAFWQERAAGSSSDAGPEATARQLVAVADDGTWAGTATVLVEREGANDIEGHPVEQSGGIVVGVYVRPEHRGASLVDGLMDAAAEWTRSLDLGRLRLYVHAGNARAQGAYRRCGFAATGTSVDTVIGACLEMTRTI